MAFGLIIPLGAQNVFVFNQGAAQSKFRRAIPVIITASICDTMLILLAVLGVSVIVLTIPVLQIVFFSIGLLFLIYMGWSIWNSDPAKLNGTDKAMAPRKQIAFAVSVSLLNPHAILDTIGVIGTNSLAYSGMEKVAFTFATIAISWLWFIGLAIAGRVVGHFDTEGKMLGIINKISAVIIWGVAMYVGYQLYGAIQ